MHPGGQIFWPIFPKWLMVEHVQTANWRMNRYRGNTLWEIPSERIVAHVDRRTGEVCTFCSASQIITHLRTRSMGGFLLGGIVQGRIREKGILSLPFLNGTFFC